MIIAIQAYFQAHRFIVKHRLWRWILIPGIIYTTLFIIGIFFFSNTSSDFIEWVALKTGLNTWLQRMNSGFLSFLFIMGHLLMWPILLLFYFSLFKYLFLIIGSPLFAYLSERTEAIMEGKTFPFSFSQYWIDIKRGIRIAARNSLWQTVYTLSFLLLSLIPLVGWLTPLLAILVECYYYGFSMLDYSMERHKKTITESIFFVGNHKGLAVGNGLVFYLMHLLPIVGWILAPAYSVVAATMSMYPMKPTQK